MNEPRRPRLVLPPGTCDTHCHVFGPPERFPYAPERTYTPAPVPKEALMAVHRRLGIGRAVVVQTGAHGTDHSALLDVLVAAGGRYRGVALVGKTIDAAVLAGLDTAGVRGVRFGFMPHLGPMPDADHVRRVAAAIAPLGWHFVVHVDARALDRVPAMLDLGLPVIVDHMARLDASRGLDQPVFAALLAILRHANGWVKLSGADRISRAGPPYADAVPFARRLLAAAPDRVLWGTDFPHPNHPQPPDDADLVDLLDEIAPDEADRRRLLVENPQRLYGFAPVANEQGM